MSNGRGRHRKTIDTVHWTIGAFVMSSLGAGTAAATVLGAQHLPETLLRIRGSWTAFLEGSQAGGAFIEFTGGMILVPEGTGTTVLWSPATDGDAPWIWWDTFQLGYEEQVTDVVAADMMWGRRVIDSKAMRKNRNQELQFVAENFTILAASSASCGGQVRVLSGS